MQTARSKCSLGTELQQSNNEKWVTLLSLNISNMHVQSSKVSIFAGPTLFGFNQAEFGFKFEKSVIMDLDVKILDLHTSGSLKFSLWTSYFYMTILLVQRGISG